MLDPATWDLASEVKSIPEKKEKKWDEPDILPFKYLTGVPELQEPVGLKSSGT